MAQPLLLNLNGFGKMDKKLAAISSEYGVLHVFLNDNDDNDLAHAVYRYIVEDLYDNEKARTATDFGPGTVAYEEHEESRDQEGESGPGLPF